MSSSKAVRSPYRSRNSYGLPLPFSLLGSLYSLLGLVSTHWPNLKTPGCGREWEKAREGAVYTGQGRMRPLWAGVGQRKPSWLISDFLSKVGKLCLTVSSPGLLHNRVVHFDHEWVKSGSPLSCPKPGLSEGRKTSWQYKSMCGNTDHLTELFSHSLEPGLSRSSRQ